MSELLIESAPTISPEYEGVINDTVNEERLGFRALALIELEEV